MRKFPLTATDQQRFIDEAFARNRAIFGDARMEGEGGEGGGGEGGGKGYTPPATQAELDRIIQDRLTRATSKFADYDEVKAKAQKHDALELELGTAADKAAAKAKADAETELRNAFVPKLVRAEFRAAAKGVLTAEQLEALLEDVDLSKFVDDKGNVDEDKIEKKVKALAPPAGSGGGGNSGGGNRSLGQGNRESAGTKAGDQARAQLAKRFPAKAGTSGS